MSVILPSAPGMTSKATATDREKLHTVAKQFEAVFVREMLASARKTSFSGDGGVGDLSSGQALETFRQLQDEHFADATVQTGNIGLAKIIEAQMQRFLPAESASGAATPSSTSAAAPATTTGPQ